MCVCVCVCVYVCVCMRAYMWVHVHVCMCVCECVCTHVCLCVHDACDWVCCMCVHMHTYTQWCMLLNSDTKKRGYFFRHKLILFLAKITQKKQKMKKRRGNFFFTCILMPSNDSSVVRTSILAWISFPDNSSRCKNPSSAGLGRSTQLCSGNSGPLANCAFPNLSTLTGTEHPSWHCSASLHTLQPHTASDNFLEPLN